MANANSSKDETPVPGTAAKDGGRKLGACITGYRPKPGKVQATSFRNVASALSVERLKAYAADDVSPTVSLSRHLLNLALCESFYSLLQLTAPTNNTPSANLPGDATPSSRSPRGEGAPAPLLTTKERAIHDAALVSTLKQLHDDLDRAVADAYSWPWPMTDAEILERVVALNAQRAKEESAGKIRWLRPDCQIPLLAPAKQTALDLADTTDSKSVASDDPRFRKARRTASAQPSALRGRRPPGQSPSPTAPKRSRPPSPTQRRRRRRSNSRNNSSAPTPPTWKKSSKP